MKKLTVEDIEEIRDAYWTQVGQDVQDTRIDYLAMFALEAIELLSFLMREDDVPEPFKRGCRNLLESLDVEDDGYEP